MFFRSFRGAAASLAALVVVAVSSAHPVIAAPISFGGNFYDFIAAPGISWSDANAAAASNSFAGVNGRLATITSSGENDFLHANFGGLDGFAGAWIAGAVNGSGQGVWQTGPEAGQIFSIGGSPVPGAYANWGGVEPNNAPGFAYMNIGTIYAGIAPGQWADALNGIASPGDPVLGYFLEYDGPFDVPGPGALSLLLFGVMCAIGNRRPATRT